MIQPRSYQVESVDDTSEALARGVKRALMLLPTAAGKSIICALIVKRVIEKDAFSRVLILCHQGHLLAQNEEKINLMSPDVVTGIYCAGQGRKEVLADVVLASRDSLANNPLCCGEFDVIICDEAHMIAYDALTNEKTQYGKIFVAHEVMEKAKYVVGLTGTPWRPKGVIWGKDKFFEEVTYNVPMRSLIDAGFLCPYVFPDTDVTVIDTSDVAVMSTGDYNSKQLEAVSIPEEVVVECLSIWEVYATNRKCSIFFACSRAHGELITEKLKEKLGHDQVCYIDGEMSKSQRDINFKLIKDGKFKALVNIGVLTTGFDAPVIDCVCWMRATRSVSLFVQMGGRGLRTAEGKQDCLMLDMAGNFGRFNSLEEPFAESDQIKKKKKGGLPGDAPTKSCPSCGYNDIAVGVKVCPYCGHLFINHDTTPHKSVAFRYYDVLDHYIDHDAMTKSGKKCVKVKFYVNGVSLPFKYLLIHHGKWPGPQHRKEYKNLLENVPLKIQVYDNPKSGFPEISIIDWIPRSEIKGCDHEWDFVQNCNGDQFLRTCLKCGELR